MRINNLSEPLRLIVLVGLMAALLGCMRRAEGISWAEEVELDFE